MKYLSMSKTFPVELPLRAEEYQDNSTNSAAKQLDSHIPKKKKKVI